MPIWGRGRWNSFQKRGMKEWICFVLSGIIYFKKFSEVFFFFNLLFSRPQSSLKSAPTIDIRLLIN